MEVIPIITNHHNSHQGRNKIAQHKLYSDEHDIL